MIERKWKKGDTLSKLAAANGFADWRRIWEYTENAKLKSDRKFPNKIKTGDIVKIPEIAKGDDGGATEQEHKFKRLGIPPAMICFVDDNGDPRNRYVKRIDVLEVSYHVTTRQLPTKWWQPSKDRRNFRLEVVDADATKKKKKTVKAKMEVLKPKLDDKGKPKLNAKKEIEYESFKPARELKMTLRRVRRTVLYRSKYIRLVTDEADRKMRTKQALLTDHDKDDLRVEILDQVVEASYKTAKDEPVSAEATIGKDIKRFRHTVQILRQSAGGKPAGGLKPADGHRHVRCWVRRTYAQANMTPELVDFGPLPPGTPKGAVSAKDPKVIGVREIDPPRNMVTIFNYWSKASSGRAVLSFRLRCDLPAGKVDKRFALDGADRIEKGETPEASCKKFAKLLTADGFVCVVHKNPRHWKNGRSADLIIWHPSGTRVVVDRRRSRNPKNPKAVRSDRHKIRTTTIKTKKYVDCYSSSYHPDGEDRWNNVGTRENRILCHNYRSGKGNLDCFVAEMFIGGNGSLGLAQGYDWSSKASQRGTYPVRATVYIVARTADRKDRQVHTLDHECGHVLADMYHIIKKATQLMTDAGPSPKNSYWGSKRIHDGRFKVGWPSGKYLNVAQDIRKREAPLLMRDWEPYPEYPEKPPI